MEKQVSSAFVEFVLTEHPTVVFFAFFKRGLSWK